MNSQLARLKRSEALSRKRRPIKTYSEGKNKFIMFLLSKKIYFSLSLCFWKSCNFLLTAGEQVIRNGRVRRTPTTTEKCKDDVLGQPEQLQASFREPLTPIANASNNVSIATSQSYVNTMTINEYNGEF
ncbi:hypothetical protein ACFE04_018429 [Oxalis oulophora]